MPAKRTILGAVALAACMTMFGCQEPELVNHYFDSGADFSRLKRIAFIELLPVDSDPEHAAEVTVALAQELQSKGLFHVQVISPEHPAYEFLPLDISCGVNMRQLRAFREKLHCDGVIVGELRHFRPYPHMQGGMQLQLSDLRNGTVAWAVEDVWDASSEATRRRGRRYFDGQVRQGYERAEWEVAILSPKAFLRFMAYEAARTLPDPYADR